MFGVNISSVFKLYRLKTEPTNVVDFFKVNDADPAEDPLPKEVKLFHTFQAGFSGF